MSKLYIIPTPIGNLEDMTHRAVRLLNEVDLILAEDTRTSKKLTNHYGIDTPLKSHHKFNEHQTTNWVIEQIQSGQNIALISDAGTPGISDPGFYLVRACVEAGVDVECFAGPTAFVPALVVSGLPSDRFVFEGFLPHKKGRQTRILKLKEEERTIILYESPHRIHKAVSKILELFEEDRQACIVREISKKFEEVIRGTLSELKTITEERTLKGEIVLIIEGKAKK